MSKINLFDAVKNNDILAVKTLIESKANINKIFHISKATYGNNRITALSQACCNNNIEIVKLLIDSKANINLQDDGVNNQTALMYSLLRGHTEIAKLLIESKVDLEKRSSANGYTAIHYAVEHFDISCKNSLEEIKLLIDSKADLDVVDKYEKTIFRKTYSSNLARLLLESKVYPDILELYSAVENIASVEICKLILEINPNINVNFRIGILDSCLNSDDDNYIFKIIKLLVEYKLDINMVLKEGDNALYRASKTGNKDMVKFLIELKADVNNETLGGFPISVAISESNNLDIVKLLVENKTNINTHRYLLPFAVCKENVEIVKYLIENKIDMDGTMFDEDSSLIVASENNNIEIVKILIESSAQTILDYKNISGNTALHSTTDENIIRYLVSSKADIYIQNVEGKTVVNNNTILFQTLITEELTKEVEDSFGKIQYVFPFPVISNGHIKLFQLISEYAIN